VDLIGGAAGGSVLPSSGDSSEVLAQKLVRSLSAASASGEVVEEAPEDGIIYGRKDAEWVDMTSPANLQVRRGTAAEVAAITPLEGEPVWATDTKKLYIGDGLSSSGYPINATTFKYYPFDDSFNSPYGELFGDPFFTAIVPPLSWHAVTIIAFVTLGDGITALSARLGSTSNSSFATFPSGVSVGGRWIEYKDSGEVIDNGIGVEALGVVASRSQISESTFVLAQRATIQNTTANNVAVSLYWQMEAATDEAAIQIGAGSHIKFERMD
jgi:hypothetical protein